MNVTLDQITEWAGRGVWTMSPFTLGLWSVGVAWLHGRWRK